MNQDGVIPVATNAKRTTPDQPKYFPNPYNRC